MIRHVVTTMVPENRRVEIELPAEVPVGEVELQITVGPDDRIFEMSVPEIDVSKLPKYFDTKSGEWRLAGRSGVVREVRNGS